MAAVAAARRSSFLNLMPQALHRDCTGHRERGKSHAHGCDDQRAYGSAYMEDRASFNRASKVSRDRDGHGARSCRAHVTGDVAMLLQYVTFALTCFFLSMIPCYKIMLMLKLQNNDNA